MYSSTGGPDLDRLAASLAPAIAYVDRRVLGFPPKRGAEEFREQLRSLFTASAHLVSRIDDVLALRSDAVLVRLTGIGTLQDGGGAWERQFLQLTVFGADGLLTRFESFDADRPDEALNRFGELATRSSEHSRVRA